MKPRLRSWNLTDWDIYVMWFLKDKLESYITPRLRTVLEGLKGKFSSGRDGALA